MYSRSKNNGRNSIIWGEEILRAGHYLRINTIGSSMSPWIKNGDNVAIKPINNISEIMVGDIIVYRSDKELVAHRLLKKKKQGDSILLLAKGDNHSIPDPPISFSQLLGKVVSIERKNSIVYYNTPFRRFLNWVITFIYPWFYSVIKKIYSLMRTTKRIWR